ncbi:glycosyltransferase [Shewanella sp. SM101]|uniref:glycosyltransferase n=1 Tax=Shewanella sp. SM101 TaxID=2912789 RepID=UPI0021D9EC98|nr:glycosyltransferase [Shewanella sp. SM101]MCU8104645.1 glycosyltransferase [Shewanella sp. SM101]
MAKCKVVNYSPLISVIIPSYNHVDYIENAINSVLSQDYPNFELIVIDDSSSDGSDVLLVQLSSKHKFIYVKNNHNLGLSKSLNKALNYAKGEFISLLASDDIFMTNKLSECISLFNESANFQSISFVFANALFMDNLSNPSPVELDGALVDNLIDYYCANRPYLIQADSVSYIDLLRGNFIPALSVLINRRYLDMVGGFDEGYILEDLSLWLKLARYGQVKKSNKNVAFYRLHDSNTTNLKKDEINKDLYLILLREFSFVVNKPLHFIVWARKTLIVASKLIFKGYFVFVLTSLLRRDCD